MHSARVDQAKRWAIGSVLAAAIAAAVGLPIPVAAQQYKQIVIATGSPFELGLIDELAKAFQKSHGGVVRCIKTPTGPGLELGRWGLTHITMGHEREATAKFAEDGFAARRTDLMHNFTVVVGPESDPAKVSGLQDLKEFSRPSLPICPGATGAEWTSWRKRSGRS
jgi:tungstate transport system substrate-binding protein